MFDKQGERIKQELFVFPFIFINATIIYTLQIHAEDYLKEERKKKSQTELRHIGGHHSYSRISILIQISMHSCGKFWMLPPSGFTTQDR